MRQGETRISVDKCQIIYQTQPYSATMYHKVRPTYIHLLLQVVDDLHFQHNLLSSDEE